MQFWVAFFIHFFQTIDLEQQAKRHMEEAMRLSLEEKDEMIKVLETKVKYPCFW